MKRHLFGSLVLLLMFAFFASCSSRGIHMPKHRRQRHCNCPTFGQTLPPEASPSTVPLAYYAVR